MKVQPYLQFNGRCEEAANFYHDALGARITTLMRVGEIPASEGYPVPLGQENRVIHLSLQIGDATVLMSDGMGEGQPNFEGFSLRLAPDDEAEANRLFARLCEGGEAMMPLSPTFWSPCFGMVKDRFGLSWMIDTSS